MTFWMIALMIALAVAGLLALTLLRPRRDAVGPAGYDLAVYRRQLAEVDRDLARGVIGEGDAERTRAEIARRVLAADTELRAGAALGSAAAPSPLLAGALALLLVAGSAALYAQIGVPGYGDLALSARIAAADQLLKDRPGQAEAEAQAPERPLSEPPTEDYRALVQRLRDTVAGRPDDLEGHVLLARHEAATGNLAAAYRAQKRVIELKGSAATAQDYVTYADMLILAAGGYVSPEAQAALDSALARDRTNGIARYYTGLLMAQTGRPDVAFRIWRQQLADGPQDAPWIEPVRAQILEAAARAGVDYTLPEPDALSGPSAEDIAAAAGMDDDARREMIRSMVDGLAIRLSTQGGDPAEWARLINALGVLGEKDQARTALAEARNQFAGNAAALGKIEEAARAAGVAE